MSRHRRVEPRRTPMRRPEWATVGAQRGAAIARRAAIRSEHLSPTGRTLAVGHVKVRSVDDGAAQRSLRHSTSVAARSPTSPAPVVDAAGGSRHGVSSTWAPAPRQGPSPETRPRSRAAGTPGNRRPRSRAGIAGDGRPRSPAAVAGGEGRPRSSNPKLRRRRPGTGNSALGPISPIRPRSRASRRASAAVGATAPFPGLPAKVGTVVQNNDKAQRLREWQAAFATQKQFFASSLIKAEVHLETCATFSMAKELPIPNEVLTAVAFGALDVVATSLTSFTGIIATIRQVMLQSVYTSVPDSLLVAAPQHDAGEGFEPYYALNTSYQVRRAWQAEMNQLRAADQHLEHDLARAMNARAAAEYDLAIKSRYFALWRSRATRARQARTEAALHSCRLEASELALQVQRLQAQLNGGVGDESTPASSGSKVVSVADLCQDVEGFQTLFRHCFGKGTGAAAVQALLQLLKQDTRLQHTILRELLGIHAGDPETLIRLLLQSIGFDALTDLEKHTQALHLMRAVSSEAGGVTASMLVSLLEELSPEERAKFLRLVMGLAGKSPALKGGWSALGGSMRDLQKEQREAEAEAEAEAKRDEGPAAEADSGSNAEAQPGGDTAVRKEGATNSSDAPTYQQADLHLSLEAMGLAEDGTKLRHSVGRFDGASDALQPFMALMNSLGPEEGLALLKKMLEHLLAMHPNRDGLQVIGHTLGLVLSDVARDAALAQGRPPPQPRGKEQAQDASRDRGRDRGRDSSRDSGQDSGSGHAVPSRDGRHSAIPTFTVGAGGARDAANGGAAAHGGRDQRQQWAPEGSEENVLRPAEVVMMTLTEHLSEETMRRLCRCTCHCHKSGRHLKSAESRRTNKRKKRRRSLVSTLPKFPTTRGKTKRYKRAKALNLVYECYAKKMRADRKEDRATGLGDCASSMRQPLGKYLRFFLLQMFGLPSLRDSNLRGIMLCVRKNEEISSRLRLFGVLCGLLHPELYSNRLCDIVLHIYQEVFPVFNAATLRNSIENECWITLKEVNAALEKVFPDTPLAFSIDRMYLTPRRKARLLADVASLAHPAQLMVKDMVAHIGDQHGLKDKSVAEHRALQAAITNSNGSLLAEPTATGDEARREHARLLRQQSLRSKPTAMGKSFRMVKIGSPRINSTRLGAMSGALVASSEDIFKDLGVDAAVDTSSDDDDDVPPPARRARRRRSSNVAAADALAAGAMFANKVIEASPRRLVVGSSDRSGGGSDVVAATIQVMSPSNAARAATMALDPARPHRNDAGTMNAPTPMRRNSSMSLREFRPQLQALGAISEATAAEASDGNASAASSRPTSGAASQTTLEEQKGVDVTAAEAGQPTQALEAQAPTPEPAGGKLRRLVMRTTRSRHRSNSVAVSTERSKIKLKAAMVLSTQLDKARRAHIKTMHKTYSKRLPNNKRGGVTPSKRRGLDELRMANRGKFVADELVVDLDTVIWTALKYWWEQSAEDEMQLAHLYHVYDANMDGSMDFHEFKNLLSAVTPVALNDERVHALFEEALMLDADEDELNSTRDKFSPEAFSILCSKHGITPTTGSAEVEAKLHAHRTTPMAK